MPRMPVLRVLVFALCISQVLSVCYLEDSSSTCSVCWQTKYADADDSVGVTTMAACNDNIVATYDTAIPELMYEGVEYPTKFALTISEDVVPQKAKIKKDEDPVADVPHANIHSCLSSRGACTPFVSNTPGLSTHTPASSGNFDITGLELTVDGVKKPASKALFEGTIDLTEDTYTIIAHIRFFVVNPDSTKNTKFDVATGVQREILPPDASVSAEAYIMAGVVGAVALVCAGAIWYAVRSGKLDLDYIMELLYSDYVTIPADVLFGMADAAAFTVSIVTSVYGKNELIDIIPIAWMFAGISWATSLYCAWYDYWQMYDLYQSFYNVPKYDERMLKTLSAEWTGRHQPKGMTSDQKKATARRASMEWDVKRMQSTHGTHHQAMLDYNMAISDFSRRRRIVMSILLESIPITVIQTYILIKGGTNVVSVLALLLAALLLGSKAQGLGDYGNAKKRRNEARQNFDSLVGGMDRLASVAARASNGTALAKVDMEAGQAPAPAPAPAPAAPSQGNRAVPTNGVSGNGAYSPNPQMLGGLPAPMQQSLGFNQMGGYPMGMNY